jgi:hypothetical protein
MLEFSRRPESSKSLWTDTFSGKNGVNSLLSQFCRSHPPILAHFVLSEGSAEAFAVRARCPGAIVGQVPISRLPGNWLSADFQLPKIPVVSMGQCNTGSKSTRRSFKTQGLSRPLIQTQGYFVQVRLREARQIGFLGQVLS